jgi:hypothetical protein
MNIKTKRVNLLVLLLFFVFCLNAQELSFPMNKKGDKFKTLTVYQVFDNENNIGFQIPFSPEKGEDNGYLLGHVDFTPDGNSLHFTYGQRFNIIDINPSFKFRESDISILHRKTYVPFIHTANSYNNKEYFTDDYSTAKLFKQKNDHWSPLPAIVSFSLIINDQILLKNFKKIWVSKYKCSDLSFDNDKNYKLLKNTKNYEKLDFFPKDLLKNSKNDTYQKDESLITLSLENSYLAQIEDTKYYTDDMAIEDGADLLLSALLQWGANTDSKPTLLSIAYIENENMLFCSYNSIPSILGYRLNITDNSIELKNEKVEAFLHGHSADINGMFPDPSGRYLVSWSERETILWDFQDGLSYQISQGQAYKPLAFSPTEPVLVLSKLASNSIDKVNIVFFDIENKIIIKDEIILKSNYEIDYRKAYTKGNIDRIAGNFVHDASFSADGSKLSLLQTFTTGRSRTKIPEIAEVPGPVHNIFVLDFEKLLGDNYVNNKLIQQYKDLFNIQFPPYLLPIATLYDEFLTNNLKKIDKKGEFEKSTEFEKRTAKTNLKNSRLIQSKWEEVNFNLTSKDKFSGSLEEINSYDADTEIYRAVLKGGLPLMIKISPKEASEFKSTWWESAIVSGQIIEVNGEPNKYEGISLSAPLKEKKFPVKLAIDSKSFFSLSTNNK